MSDRPTPRPPSPDHPFEIGLVMAGAISAGAYTAGFVDFLIQALDQWELAKALARANPEATSSRECPMHAVRIKVIAGASAGGMTAGLAAGLLGMTYESVTTQTSPDSDGPPILPVNNNLYRSWVNTIDIDPLLSCTDLDADPDDPVQSMLDSTIIRSLADDAFRFERPDETLVRPYVCDALHVLMTVTNLRGIPYPVTFANSKKIPEYMMTLHADNMHFVVSNDPTESGPEGFWLRPHDYQNPGSWGVLQNSTVATGAFPVGLAAQLLSRPPSQYNHREWAIPTPCSADPACSIDVWKAIPPLWPAINQAVTEADRLGKPFEYQFLCVDGGVTNNEPLDLARRILAGADGVNPRQGDKATRAVIMVEPFPNAGEFPVDYSGRTNLLGLLGSIFGSLISQSRFKPEELTLADDPDVYSRFLIVPRRAERDGAPLEPYAIACGSLHGFGGFLSRRFREHDYQLGRRNCQEFLKTEFALPSEGVDRNKLFDAWTAEARACHPVVNSESNSANSPTSGFLPIIPLMGTAEPEVPLPVWPTYLPEDLAGLRPRVSHRFGRVVGALIDQNIKSWFFGPPIRWSLKFFWWLMGGQVVNKVMQTIQDDLTKRGLLR